VQFNQTMNYYQLI